MHKVDKKLLGILFCISCGIAILITSLYYSKIDQPYIGNDYLLNFGSEWQVHAGTQVYPDVELPANIAQVKPGDTLVLEKALPSNIDSHLYLFFRASQQKVKVYLKNVLVYRFGWDEQRMFGKSPASAWIVVSLSQIESDAPVRIELTGAYQRYAGRINGIYIGDKSAIINKIIGRRLGSLLISLILMIFGVGMLGITISLRNHQITTSLQRLGIMSILIGSWSICVTNTLQLFYPNVYFLLNLEFFLFNLLLPSFLWFLLSFPYYTEQKCISRCFWASIAQFILIEALQLTGLADYMQSLVLTHLMISVCVGYLIFTGIRDLLKKRAPKEVKLLIFSVIILLLFIGIDLVRFYQYVTDEGFFTRIGALIFIVLWAIAVIHNMSLRFVALAKTKALEVLAYEDLMTGLKNRTAFEESMSQYQSRPRHEIYIITFDMNGLKNINDHFGHTKGDEAIIATARIIKSAFEPYGICYRIGGDEICVILPKTKTVRDVFITNALRQIDDAVQLANKTLALEFSVASGYSTASPRENRDMDQAYREADLHMYARKQQMKAAKLP